MIPSAEEQPERPATIRVMVCDDHHLFTQSFVPLISEQPDIEVVATASTGEQAIEKAARLRPDVILMDLSLPGIQGDEATALIKKQLPDVQIIALTGHSSDYKIRQAIAAGACGYKIKEEVADTIPEAIREANNGGSPLSPTVAKRLINQIAPSEQGSTLNNDELEAVQALAHYGTNREIGKAIHRSERQVTNLLASAGRKLGITDYSARNLILAAAVRQGYVDLT